MERLHDRREKDGWYVIEHPDNKDAWVRSYGSIDLERWR